MLLIEGAFNTLGTTVENVSVNHGGFDIFMSQEFLNSTTETRFRNIVTGFEKVGGEAMPEGMARGMFVDASFSDGLFNSFLEGAFTHVPTAHEARFFFRSEGCRGEYILPTPFAVYIGIFADQRVR